LGGTEIKGSIYAIVAGASFAAFSVGIEAIEQEGSGLAGRLRFLAIVFFLGYVGMVTIAYIERRVAVFDTEALIILGANGARIAIVYALFQAAIRRIGALLASVIVALEVPFTMLGDWLFLGRVPSVRLIWGATAILLGAITLAWQRSSQAPPEGRVA
jgi:drug/metabolite transporter (DMT)-like permease